MSKSSGLLGVGLAVIVVGGAFSGGGSTYAPATAVSPATAQAPPASAALASDPGCVQPTLAGLTKEQTGIARRGVQAADRAGVGDVGAAIIVSTGLVESGLRNLTYGDRDSLGWLQQRPSQGWANATDVDKGADDFFREMKKLVPGWQGMDPGAVAQKVQRSAYPARYGERMAEARNIVAAIRGEAATCKPATTAAGAVSGKAGTVLAWAQTQVGKPYRLGANGPNAWDCSSFSKAAMAQVGITMPRTAQAQRDWCAAGNCTRIPDGQERPGDLLFWDSYLGPNTVGHVVLVKDPSKRQTTDARSTKLGVINGTYPQASSKTIFEFWRPKGLA